MIFGPRNWKFLKEEDFPKEGWSQPNFLGYSQAGLVIILPQLGGFKPLLGRRIELLNYLRDIEDENVLLIDARSRDWYKRGTIPTAIISLLRC